MMFTVPQNVSVKALLSSAASPQNALKGCVNQRVQFDSLTVKVTTPHRGDFCLKLLTKGKRNKYSVVCNYLLTTDEFNSKKKPRTYENAEEKNARTRLFDALIKGDNPDDLQDAIDKFKVLNLPDDGEVEKAKTRVCYLKTMKDFKEGLSRRSLPILEKALDNSKILPKTDEMKPLVRQGTKMVKNLKTLKKHSHDVLALSSRTISELHRYQDPVPVMVDIMRATYLLLGEDDASVADWEKLQTIMRKTGRDSLSVRIRMFDVTKVKIPLAKKVLQTIQKYDKDTAIGASAGAGTFYLWASGVAQDVISEESTTITDNTSTSMGSPQTLLDTQRDTPGGIPHDTPCDIPSNTPRDEEEVPITSRTDSVSTCLSVICV
ncbi:uncharacterized protein LOC132562026 [Ylistrum balloti]|uniref:uncharacterized protein LOC132562026 n=1 Tax=Ylistrum balloti TaxID=509963 RepID=UPI002905EB83|nr:uncharacterized protein LOC132562026 [Ylistrum balloti]